jgi:cyclophilin family peptidyl-prolyl cis-trans isomerase
MTSTGRRNHTATAIALLLCAGCAAAPPPKAPEPLVIPARQKQAWILQLEDQRLLRLPEPPNPAPPPPVKGRRPAPVVEPPAPTSSPDLGVLIRDPDARIRRRAALAIGRVKSKDGVSILVPALADTDPDVRAMAAFALGLVGDPTAESALTPLLADVAPIVRGRAAEALGLIGAKEAAPAISKMVNGYALSPAVGRMSADDETWPAPPEAEAFKLGLFALVRLRSYDAIASAVLESGRAVTSWWPVAYALQRVEDPRAAPALGHLLGVRARYTPAFAARGLGALKDTSAVDGLVALLEPAGKFGLEVTVAAIRSLAQLGATRAAERLAQLASDRATHPNIRLEAVTALGPLRAAEGLAVVQDRLTDDWPAMRAAALRAAAAIDEEGFLFVLSGMEADRHWRVRATLAEILGGLPAETATERVRSMLEDEDKRVIPAVLGALARLKVPDLQAILQKRLDDSDVAVRSAAARELGRLKPVGGADALRAAYKAAVPDIAYTARAAALDALAEYGQAEAAETLREALQDKEWGVRVRAAEHLAKLDPTSDADRAIRPAPGPAPSPYDDPELLAPTHSPHVFIETVHGTIEFELAVLDAPQSARNFVTLARKGFFNGLEIHRVVPNFVVQDGDPRGDGEGGPGYTIRDELNERPFLRGTVGMALDWRDTGGSQFFITHSPQPHLDARYTVFGHVVQGLDVVDRIKSGDVIQRIRVWDGKGWE